VRRHTRTTPRRAVALRGPSGVQDDQGRSNPFAPAVRARLKRCPADSSCSDSTRTLQGGAGCSQGLTVESAVASSRRHRLGTERVAAETVEIIQDRVIVVAGTFGVTTLKDSRRELIFC
jgi:hypothetical protein